MSYKQPTTVWIDTVTPLGAGLSYTGVARDMRLNKNKSVAVWESFDSEYNYFNLISRTDQNSATNWVAIQWSLDGTTWYTVETDTIVVATLAHSHIQAPVTYPFMRVSFTNGWTLQGNLQITSSVI